VILVQDHFEAVGQGDLLELELRDVRRALRTDGGDERRTRK
jgi:hypothetical protein